MRALLLTLGVLPLLAGCTGLALGENDPNGNLGTWLGTGDIAVDPSSETSFVLVHQKGQQGTPPSATLHAVRAGESTSESVLDLSGRHDPRLLFTSNGVFVMSQKDHKEHFTVLDPATFSPRVEADSDTWYWGTRLSASRRWVGVADNAKTKYPLNVIDSESLDIRVLPHGGDQVEMMFANVTDELFAISVDDVAHGGRILGWDMTFLSKAGFATGEDGLWAGSNFDVPIDNVAFDELFSYSWVAVSPDDRQVVVPLLAWRDAPDWPADADHFLAVLDTRTRETRLVPDAKGPVGFTPDGATIVSYNDAGLVLIDAQTLVTEEETVPNDGGIHFFVSHAGNFVLVASSTGGEDLVLVDTDSGKQTKMKGRRIDLGMDEFVSRTDADELWAVQGGGLFKVDLDGATISQMDLPFKAEHIGILPKRDELVLGSNHARRLHFLDPDTLEERRTVDFSAE
jgi:hypothetical protein